MRFISELPERLDDDVEVAVLARHFIDKIRVLLERCCIESNCNHRHVFAKTTQVHFVGSTTAQDHLLQSRGFELGNNRSGDVTVPTKHKDRLRLINGVVHWLVPL